jgi:hypothetical protein
VSGTASGGTGCGLGSSDTVCGSETGPGGGCVLGARDTRGAGGGIEASARLRAQEPSGRIAQTTKARMMDPPSPVLEAQRAGALPRLVKGMKRYNR